MTTRFVQWSLVLVAALWVALSFTYPFGWDQGLFAWVGGAIVHGGMPYVDAWDFKGPLVYYVYALAEALFGVHLWGIRILDAAFLLVATLSVRRVAAVLTDAASARWAALLYFLWYASQSFWHTAQPDGWTGMLLITGLAPVISRVPPVSAARMALAGVALGAVTLFKPVYGLFLLLPLAYIEGTRWSSRVIAMAPVIAGWLLPIALMTAWFAVRGALDELIAVHLQYSAFYVRLGPGARLDGLVEYFLSGTVMTFALPAVIYGSVILWKRSRRVAIVLVTWVALSVFCAVLQNRFFAYHWLPIVPAATLLATVGLHDLLRRMKPLAYVMGGAIFLRSLAPIGLEEVRYVSWMVGRIDREAYYDAYGEPGDDMKTVWWLKERAQPGSVFVFGFHSGVGWLSGRQTVSRFGYSLPLMLGDGALEFRYRAELLESLRATPPRYIVVAPQSEEIIGRVRTVDDFPELATLIAHDYRAVEHFGGITIYEAAR